MEDEPFVGSEALADRAVTWHELDNYSTAIMPNVYLDKRVTPTLRHRTHAAWLWSGREAVIAGISASALHGARWVDDDAVVDLIWRNARTPRDVKTRDDLLLDGETRGLGGLQVTTPERTAFDLGRRGPLTQAVARLDALANAMQFKVEGVAELAVRHRHTRGLRQLETALDHVDAGAQSPKETWLRLLSPASGGAPTSTPDSLGRKPRSPSSAKTATRAIFWIWGGRTSCSLLNTTATNTAAVGRNS